MVCFFLSCLFGTRGRNLKSIFFFFSFLLFFKTENHASQCNLRWVSQSGEHGNWEGFQTLTQIQVCSHHPGLLYCFTNFPSCSRSGGCHAVGPGAPPAAQRELWPAKAHSLPHSTGKLQEYRFPSHTDAWQKASQYCKVIILVK